MRKLKTCHEDLQRLFNEVIKGFDNTIEFGHRGKKRQNKCFEDGTSTLTFPFSKHNKKPSLAVDAVPYIRGKGKVWEKKQCYYFAGYVKRVAEEMNINIRGGSDWDRDNDVNDQTLLDPVHVELIL